MTRADGKDFVPTPKWVVFGHHFAAIAGPGPLVGPVLGAFSLMMLEESFQSITKHWQLLIGAVIVLVALYLPRGFAGLLRNRADTDKPLPPPGGGGSGTPAAAQRPHV